MLPGGAGDLDLLPRYNTYQYSFRLEGMPLTGSKSVRVSPIISICVFLALVLYNALNIMPHHVVSDVLVLLAYVSPLILFLEWRLLPLEKRYSWGVVVVAMLVVFVICAITVYGFNTAHFEPL